MKYSFIAGAVLGLVVLCVLAIVALPRILSEERQSAVILENKIFPKTEATPKTYKLLFGGDLMFDRDIRIRMQQRGVDFILQPLTPTFNNYDLVIANLEGPVTDNPSRSVGSAIGSSSNFIFTFDPSILPMLKQNKFEVVNLGNNHILNFGKDGVAQTKKYLDQNDIAYFGDTSTESHSAERIFIYELGEHTIAFVNYNEFVPNGYEHALEDLAAVANQADIVIVYTHWGAEYQPRSNQVIQNQAHTFIDNGADLIIGSHPHVKQQVEEYHGKKIYYSLGNFVFDQYFDPETQKGLLVGLEIAPDGTMSFKEIPIVLERSGQVKLAD